jgi:hypothetical protein
MCIKGGVRGKVGDKSNTGNYPAVNEEKRNGRELEKGGSKKTKQKQCRVQLHCTGTPVLNKRTSWRTFEGDKRKGGEKKRILYNFCQQGRL